jgi:acetyltransferase-like isoleucine patch superfamily enzyme
MRKQAYVEESGMVRLTAKAAVFVIGLMLVIPLICLSWVEHRMWKGERLFGACAQFLSLIPSHLGVVLRGAFYFGALESCSWETHIGFGSLFTHRGAVLAAHVSTGAYCFLGHVNIGHRVMLASRVSVPSGRRQHFDESGAIVTKARYDTVRIGAGAWVGEGAILLADVGQGCVVSAGAIVTKPIPDRTIVGGNPARIIKRLDCSVPDEFR